MAMVMIIACSGVTKIELKSVLRPLESRGKEPRGKKQEKNHADVC
jgi:hypothetical protein